MSKLKSIFTYFIVSISFSIIGCSNNPRTNGITALFDTKVEAEKAANNFNCTGAHKMGEKWMPCRSHGILYETEENQNHVGHHHH